VAVQTEAVWHAFRQPLRNYIARRVPNASDTDDILQDVFLKVHRHLPTLENEERLVPWLYRVARNTLIDRYRRAEGQEALEEAGDPRVEEEDRDAAQAGFDRKPDNDQHGRGVADGGDFNHDGIDDVIFGAEEWNDSNGVHAGRAFVFVWQIVMVEAVRDAAHEHWIGRSVSELAEEQGIDPLDCFLDMALAEDLTTQFGMGMPPSQTFDDIIATMIRDPIVMAGSSDAGAHLLSFVGADYTTRLLSEWVPKTLSLEAAVSRLTMMPATVHGLHDRGVIRTGAAADLVLFDPTRLAAGRTHLVHDFPADSPRFVVDAEGYVALIVNGVVLLQNGEHTGALPGQVLRGQ
jgi:hypothetical protein